jgi:hypothetical protein
METAKMTEEEIRKQLMDRFDANYEAAEKAGDLDGAFMLPQWDDFDPDLIDWQSEDDRETCSAVIMVRLSASGYLDCSDWTPISGCCDLDQWFDIFVSKE